MLIRKETSSSLSNREFNTADTAELISMSRIPPFPKLKNSHSKQVPPILTWINNQNLAYIFLVASSFLLVGGYTFSSYKNINPIETTLIRFIFQTILQSCVVIKNNTKLYIINPRDHKIVVVRGLFAASHAFILALAQYYLSLNVIFTINSAGIIFAFVLNYLRSQIKITDAQKKGLICGVIGLILAMVGRFVYSVLDSEYTFVTHFPNYRVQDKFWNLFCTVLFMLWMVIWAYSLIYGGTNVKQDFNQIIFINSVIGLLVFAVLYQCLEIRSNLWLFAQIGLTTGVMLSVSNYLFSWALFISTNMGMSSLVNQFTVIVSYLVSIFWYHQSINFICLVGSVFTIFGVKLILIKR